MALNIDSLLGNFTSKITETVSSKAKDSAIKTLSDPELKATVTQFTKDWAYDNRFILGPIFLGIVILSILAIANIITSFRANRRNH